MKRYLKIISLLPKFNRIRSKIRYIKMKTPHFYKSYQ
ncbi:MAG: hypothetical protein DDT32_01404 [Syntrophomonadaceae bacterium]|nr:hypothetical protein [Bacillota bacterium]